MGINNKAKKAGNPRLLNKTSDSRLYRNNAEDGT